jgi:hypothetical protein
MEKGIVKSQPQPEKRLAYGNVIRKETAEKLGVDVKSVVEDTTGSNPFSKELSKPITQEEEFLRWTTNKSLTASTVDKIIKYLKKNKLDIKESENWNPALEKVNEMPVEEAVIPTPDKIKQYDFKAVAKICLKISDDFLELADLLKGM